MNHIKEIAERRARAAEHLRILGASNAAGRTFDEAISASARYQLALDAFAKADSDYQLAIRALTADELLSLAADRSKVTP